MKLVGRIVSTVALLVLASNAVASDKTQIERGKYLVNFGGCHDCHTPKIFGPEGPKLDETRLLSGSPAEQPLPPIDKKALQPGNWMLMGPDLTSFVGPWGVTRSANLTPDEQTGLGLWTEEHFLNTIKTGKHMGTGRPIMPPMFIELLGNLTLDDQKAIFAYLKSLPPIKNAVVQPIAPPDVK